MNLDELKATIREKLDPDFSAYLTEGSPRRLRVTLNTQRCFVDFTATNDFGEYSFEANPKAEVTSYHFDTGRRFGIKLEKELVRIVTEKYKDLERVDREEGMSYLKQDVQGFDQITQAVQKVGKVTQIYDALERDLKNILSQYAQSHFK